MPREAIVLAMDEDKLIGVHLRARPARGDERLAGEGLQAQLLDLVECRPRRDPRRAMLLFPYSSRHQSKA